MISQETVQQAFEAINKPCTIKDIMQWLFENKIIDYNPETKTKHGHDVRNRVANRLMKLRNWKIIDRLPQGHYIDDLPVFYLVKNGDPHVKPCAICHKRDVVYGNRLRQIMVKHYKRRVKLSPAYDARITEEYEGGPSW